jgi:hypothetical protein
MLRGAPQQHYPDIDEHISIIVEHLREFEAGAHAAADAAAAELLA